MSASRNILDAFWVRSLTGHNNGWLLGRRASGGISRYLFVRDEYRTSTDASLEPGYKWQSTLVLFEQPGTDGRTLLAKDVSADVRISEQPRRVYVL